MPRIYKEDEGNLPVVGISFDAALEFCGWFWEERLGADPDLVVDLPTWKEYILAARGDRLTYNFPWGPTLLEGESINLGTSRLWSVTRDDAVFYDGFLDLVGNAAEWVYWWDDPATTGGARVVGQQARIGSLEAGKRADVIVVDMSRPRQQPLFDAVAQIVYASRGDDVLTTIVNGRILMRDRKVLTMNEAAVLNEARAAADLVRKAVR